MNKFRLYSKGIFLIWGLFIIASYPAFAKEQQVEKYPPVTKEEHHLVTKQDKCFNNFNINSIDFSDPKVIQISPLLIEYFQCRATVKDSINECNKLKGNPEFFDICRGNFNAYQALFGRIVRDGRVTPGMFSLWEGGGPENAFESFVEAFLKEDISSCENVPIEERNECSAVISGNDSLCKSDACASKAAYVKAIRSGNINDCSKIKNNSIKSMCRGYISRDEKICEEGRGFGDFKHRYCK
ncbi:MAG: hypothetical protein AABY28_00595 [Candidatus Omnitrophota bacterium]